MMEPLKILVADDNEDAAEALGLLLGFHGHEVRLARDGREALEAARAWEPDVVLLVLEMPVMNGFAAAQAIREETEFPVLSPKKSGTGHRLYRRKDVELLLRIKHLLYEKKFTIEGARQTLHTESRGPKPKPVKRVQQDLFAEDPLPEIRRELGEILALLK